MRTTNALMIQAASEWLSEHYPTPYPVQVRLLKDIRDEHGERLLGHSYSRGKRLFIDIRMGRKLDEMLETLAHEWGHLVHLPFTRQESLRKLRQHDPLTGWGNTYAAIYSDFFDDPPRFKP